MLLSGIDTELKSAIVRALFFAKESTCNELSNSCGKSVPLVTRVILELIRSGWVVETGYGISNGGRRPMLYALKKQDYYLICVSMNRLGTKIAVLDIDKKEVGETIYVGLPLSNNENAVPELVRVVQSILKNSKLPTQKILGIGISMPGFINSELGINYSYLRPPGEDSLGKYLSKEIQLPVHIDNDSSALALGELRFGVAKSVSVAMVLNIGWGIGLGMIVNHHIFRGFTGFAGELSHIPISDSEIMCECGKKGCLETEATLLVISKKAIEIIASGEKTNLPKETDIYKMSEALMGAANAGNQEAIELINEMGYKIGKAIAILIHIENPELIVLSGRGAAVGRFLMASIQQALNRYCIPRLAKNTKLEISSLGKNADLVGAATLVMENFGRSIK